MHEWAGIINSAQLLGLWSFGGMREMTMRAGGCELLVLCCAYVEEEDTHRCRRA